MRLINATKLEEKLIKEIEKQNGYFTKANLNMFLDFVKDCPTFCNINRGKEYLGQYGRWLFNEESESWICSNCYAAAMHNMRGHSTYSPFCPNCGAKMEVEYDGYKVER